MTDYNNDGGRQQRTSIFIPSVPRISDFLCHFGRQQSVATTPGRISSRPATVAAIARCRIVRLILVGAGEIANGAIVLVDGRISIPSLLPALLAILVVNTVQFRAVEVTAAPGGLRALPIFNRCPKGHHGEGL